MTGPVHNKNWTSTSDWMFLTYQTVWSFKNEADDSYIYLTDLIVRRSYALF